MADAVFIAPQRSVDHAILDPGRDDDEWAHDSTYFFTVCILDAFEVDGTNNNRRVKHVTYMILFCLAGYSAVYGVTFAYLLHHVANIFSAWLVVLYLVSGGFSIRRIFRILEGEDNTGLSADGKHKKKP